MIDLHTHTLFSDGELVPAELLRRAKAIGFRAIAFTDHVDESNYDFVVERLRRFCDIASSAELICLAGGEITHVPPERIGSLTQKMRALGAELVLVHGETVVEPVAPGTNRAAIEAGVDILAHPGLITDEEAILAAQRGVALELSGRGGHSFSNGHVVNMAIKHGATLLFNSDSHKPSDLMSRSMAQLVIRSAGVASESVEALFTAAEALVTRTQQK
jgi:histidinol phosphatase-like PHP family hydrolase